MKITGVSNDDGPGQSPVKSSSEDNVSPQSRGDSSSSLSELNKSFLDRNDLEKNSDTSTGEASSPAHKRRKGSTGIIADYLSRSSDKECQLKRSNHVHFQLQADAAGSSTSAIEPKAKAKMDQDEIFGYQVRAKAKPLWMLAKKHANFSQRAHIRATYMKKLLDEGVVPAWALKLEAPLLTCCLFPGS